MSEQYLWDRSGEPDTELQRLESVMAQLRMPERRFQFPAERVHSSSWAFARWSFPASATALVAIAVAMLLLAPSRDAGWKMKTISGTPEVDGKSVKHGTLRVGDLLQTGRDARVRLQVDGIGELEVNGAARLQLVESHDARKRLAMQYGTIHAFITAPPAVFVVDTPAARAVDLGCEYTLSIDAAGNGRLQVDSGWVQLDYEYTQSLVPAGAQAEVRSGGRITPAFYSDATTGFRSALERFALGTDLPRTEREQALSVMLAEARQRDAYTLISLFRRSTREERLMLFDRLNELVPAPAGVDRGLVAAGDLRTLNPWWEAVRHALALSTIKKNKPLNLGVYHPSSE